MTLQSPGVRSTNVIDLTDAARETPRQLGGRRPEDRLAVIGAAVSSLAITAAVFTQLTPFSGVVGFLAFAFATFIAVYALIVSFDEPGPIVRDRLVAVLIHGAAAFLVAALAIVVGFTLWKGRQALTHANFFTEDMTAAGPLEPLSVGGIKHAIVGTLEQIGIALTITVPLGLLCAVFLNFVPGRFARLVRTLSEAMTALPSIVAGLFVYATVILSLGVGKCGLAAALALSVEMLPIIIRASDVVLRLVPGTLVEASLATGASQWRTVWHVVLPTARSGLATAVILGTARGIGETAPVLLAAGYTTGLNADAFSGPQVSLPLAAFTFVKSPEPAMVARGFGTAAVLMLLVLLLFAVARVLGGRAPGNLSRRAAAARRRRSAQDVRRMQARSRREARDDDIPTIWSTT